MGKYIGKTTIIDDLDEKELMQHFSTASHIVESNMLFNAYNEDADRIKYKVNYAASLIACIAVADALIGKLPDYIVEEAESDFIESIVKDDKSTLDSLLSEIEALFGKSND